MEKFTEKEMGIYCAIVVLTFLVISAYSFIRQVSFTAHIGNEILGIVPTLAITFIILRFRKHFKRKSKQSAKNEKRTEKDIALQKAQQEYKDVWQEFLQASKLK